MKNTEQSKFENFNLDLKYYLQVLYRRKWFLFTIFVLFVVAGVLYTAKQRRTYKASAILSITPPQKLSVGNIEIQEQMHVQLQYFVNTQKQILQGEGTVAAVIEQLDDKTCIEFFDKSKSELRIIDVQKAISITHTRNAYIFQISVVGPHHTLCADIANLIVSVYIDAYNRSEKSSQNKFLLWLNEEVPERRSKLQEAEEALRNFEEKNKNVIFLANPESDFDAATVNNLANEILNVTIKLLTKKSNYDKCAEARRKKSLEAILRLDFFEESSLLGNLRQKEFELQQQYEENRLRYQPQHQKMIWLSKSLGNIQRKIKQEALLFIHRQEQEYLHLVYKKQELLKLLGREKSKILKERQVYIDYQHAQKNHEFQTKAYESFIDEIEKISATTNYEVNNIRQVYQAIPADQGNPYRPRRLLNYIISAFLGLFMGIACIFTLEGLDETVQNQKDIEEMTSISIIGQIPFISKRSYGKNIERVVTTHSRSAVSEAFRSIVTNLFLSETAHQTFAVTSPWAGDGKTVTATNISQSIAKSGKKTLLIDADLYKPRIQSCLALEDGPGFGDLIQDKVSVDDVARVLQENLWCITAGELPSDPNNALYNSKIKDIIKELEQKYDYVIFDTPPIGLISDVLLLEKSGAKMFFVISTFKSSKKMLKNVFNRLEILKVSLQGIILNSKSKVDSNLNKQYYDYYGK